MWPLLWNRLHCDCSKDNWHYEKSCTGMNVFRKGMNSFRNGMNIFRTGMKTFRIGTGIWGNQNYQKIRNFSGSKNLKEFFQNSKVLKSSYQTKPNLKSWNFEKILSESYSQKNFWFFGSFGFPKFQYLSGTFSFWFRTYSFHSGMNSYRSRIHSFWFNFFRSVKNFYVSKKQQKLRILKLLSFFVQPFLFKKIVKNKLFSAESFNQVKPVDQSKKH